jgi:hypothetical protein
VFNPFVLTLTNEHNKNDKMSISSFRYINDGKDGLKTAINRCDTLGELVDLIPAPFRPRMQDLVNQVYKAALKSNHARSYLTTLETHNQDGTFPSEIQGRVHTPALQISKEYTAAAEYKMFLTELDASTRAHKKAMLTAAIKIKKAEVSHLQRLFAETTYKSTTATIYREVVTQLVEDAGISPNADGTVPKESFPQWFAEDSTKFEATRLMYPQRAVALAYVAVQRENSKKFKTLNLKHRTDEDVEMQDFASKTDTVQALIAKSLEQFKKELKIQNPGMPEPSPLQGRLCLTDTPRKRKEKPQGKSQTQLSTKADSEGQQVQGRKRKRERREEVSRQAESLERAFRGFAVSRASACFGLAPLPGSTSRAPACGVVLSAPLTDLRRKDRVVVSTPVACLFLELQSELFCGVSALARQQFVSHHTPVSLFELGHQFMEGIFKGPDVVIPREIEYKLALNSKFILHHSPNSLRVHQAWPHLERSVRLRWHFRNSQREQSKFYVPKKSWSPPKEQWNDAIENGLRKGKDLLFAKTAALNLPDRHRSNPDLRFIHDFLQSRQLLLKITDKNLGLAAISKPWYLEKCSSMLSDTETYDEISSEDLVYYQHAALERIEHLANSEFLSEQISEYLHASKTDVAIPVFHAIPKVHKTPWTLRPIVPSHSWVTRRASEICDFVLRGFHQEKFPWIVDSTRKVIIEVNKHTISRSDNVWLITGDVESFYTNVNTTETIAQLRPAMAHRNVEQGIKPNLIPDLLEVVMACNCFEFNSKSYHQVNGVAMGTSCAPAFANIALAFKEFNVKSIVRLLDNANVVDGLILYVRYIDDIFAVFKGSRAACQSCLDDVSSSLQPFKIDWKIHSIREPISFLDVEFFFEQGFGPVGIQSRVFRKRMNQHQYIPWSSAHPDTVKKAFIKAELTRFMVISSTRALFEDRVAEFMKALGRRGYPSSILHIWKKQVRYEDRWYSLSKRKDTTVRGQPLMLPSSYDEIWEYTDLQDVFSVMMNEWVQCGEPLPQSLFGPLIKSLKRTENLFDKFSSWNKAILMEPATVPVSVPLPPLRSAGL